MGYSVTVTPGEISEEVRQQLEMLRGVPRCEFAYFFHFVPHLFLTLFTVWNPAGITPRCLSLFGSSGNGCSRKYTGAICRCLRLPELL